MSEVDDLNREPTTEDREYFSFTRDPSGKIARRTIITNASVPVKNASPFGIFDKVLATYPTSTTEVFTYSFESDDLGTVTVTYTTSSKKFLSSVVYSAI